MVALYIAIKLVSSFWSTSLLELALVNESPKTMSICTYPSVCVGGTFDIFHHGHRVLLSIAALLTSHRLLVGVTDASILQKKILAPLIQTFDMREAAVKNFLTDIDFPEEQLKTYRLVDPFGPPSCQPDFQCIIASPETVPVRIPGYCS